MNIKINHPLRTLHGDALQCSINGQISDLTLKQASIECLLGQYQGESLGGMDKFKRYQLAQKIHAAGDELELTAEEISLIKDLIGKAYGPNVVGPAYLALEGHGS